MRVLVFSDSHGRTQPMLDAVELYRPEAMFHLGDMVRDTERLRETFPQIPLYQVQGNCDLGRADCETEGVTRLAGKTVFYLHGHTRHVKLGVGPAMAAARGIGADILLFGHTHSPLCIEDGGLLAVNPGAVLDGCCAVLSWAEDGEIAYLPVNI